MKIDPGNAVSRVWRGGAGTLKPTRSAPGSAMVIVLVLLSVMAALVASNVVTLRRLRVELQLLEARQIRALGERAAALNAQADRTSANR